MSAPLIGITTRNTDSPLYKIPLIASPRSYIEAVITAGAIPVLLPINLPPVMLSQMLAQVDGVLFTGGGDIDLPFYDGVPHESVYDTDLERDSMELSFIHDVLAVEKPMLGICRGIQVLNVAKGGTLYADIRAQYKGEIEHQYFPDYPWNHIAHPIQIKEESILARIVGEPVINVNSLHHQSIKEMGRGLAPIAHAPDGVIEAVSIDDYPFGMAVQWHPEWLPDDSASVAIFEAFVSEASRG